MNKEERNSLVTLLDSVDLSIRLFCSSSEIIGGASALISTMTGHFKGQMYTMFLLRGICTHNIVTQSYNQNFLCDYEQCGMKSQCGFKPTG